jgi:hypothetical protein
VTPQSDCGKVRLQEPEIDHRKPELSFLPPRRECFFVPADGRPIVLMADRQTTGTRFSSIFRKRTTLPGGAVTFRQIDSDSAQKLALRRESFHRRVGGGGKKRLRKAAFGGVPHFPKGGESHAFVSQAPGGAIFSHVQHYAVRRRQG